MPRNPRYSGRDPDLRAAMRPALLPILLPILLSACALAGAQTPAPATPRPPLLPLDQLLAAPAPVATAETAQALADRGSDLRQRAAAP